METTYHCSNEQKIEACNRSGA